MTREYPHLDLKPRFARLWKACFSSVCHGAGHSPLTLSRLALVLCTSSVWTHQYAPFPPGFWLGWNKRAPRRSGRCSLEAASLSLSFSFSLILSPPISLPGFQAWLPLVAHLGHGTNTSLTLWAPVRCRFSPQYKDFPYITFKLFILSVPSVSFWHS